MAARQQHAIQIAVSFSLDQQFSVVTCDGEGPQASALQLEWRVRWGLGGASG